MTLRGLCNWVNTLLSFPAQFIGQLGPRTSFGLLVDGPRVAHVYTVPWRDPADVLKGTRASTQRTTAAFLYDSMMMIRMTLINQRRLSLDIGENGVGATT